ncbi:MAG: hypothetical protein E7663_06770 [Ruminococcaceae bacterium]|nr:hypothetical protein [Oscillospiraceae bacterium]
MRLDSKYYSYCKQIGILKENCSHQSALDTIIKAVKGTKQADPEFVEAVSKLTLSSPEVSIRSCMLYRYDIELDYWVNGNKRHGRIADFGQSGVPDSLQITNYAGDGTYTVLKDFSSVPYSIYNDQNIFTFEEIKNALKGVINKQIPKGTTRYESTEWWVSAYIVPVLVICLNFKGKEYQMYYNLQNNRYHWKWADNPKLLENGKKARTYATLIKIAAFFFNVLGIILAISGEFSAFPFVVGLAALVINILIAKKKSKTKKQYQDMFLKNPTKKLASALKTPIAMAIIAFIAFIIGAAG